MFLQIQLLQNVAEHQSTWQEQRMVGNMVVVVVAVVIESVDEPSTYLMYVFPPSHSDAQLHFFNLTQRQLEAARNFLDCHFIVLGMM